MEGEEKKDADPAAIYGVDDKEKTSDRITRYSKVKGSTYILKFCLKCFIFGQPLYFRIYACATMWHESEEEQLGKMIFNSCLILNSNRSLQTQFS